MRWTAGVAFLLAVVGLAAPVTTAQAQVASLYYKEVQKDGRIYVFNTAERFKSWEASGDMGTAITLTGAGPNGETVVGENETALDLYFFKHDLPGYERPAPKPAAPVVPTTLKVGDGELKFGTLLQFWYVMDDSPSGATSTAFYGNYPGNNTFLTRRAEIKLSGKITKTWAFDVMIDAAKRQQFTSSGIQVQDDKILQDIGITYVGLKGHEFTLGQRKIVLTDESGRSSSDLDFAERARMTRLFSDRREAGFFYKGDYGRRVTLWASVTNGTRSNVPDASNDTLFSAVKVDLKPAAGWVVGGSGGYGAGESSARLANQFYGAHLRFDGTETLPLLLRAEYMKNTTEQASGPDVNREGLYGSVLYTFGKKYRFGIRYEDVDPNTDTDDNSIKTLTAGFQYLIKGRNINLKFEWNKVTEEGRTIAGELAEDYNVGIVAAQVSF